MTDRHPESEAPARSWQLPLPHDDGTAERAARLATLAWWWAVTREPYASHAERIRALQASGTVADEEHFRRLGRA